MLRRLGFIWGVTKKIYWRNKFLTKHVLHGDGEK